MNYDETIQKQIVREMERDLLAIVAVDVETDEYEVIYSDGAYRNFENRYHREDFFSAWNRAGIALVFEPDRDRMRYEISKEHLLGELSEKETYNTICRFFVGGEPEYCRIKVARDVVEKGNLIISVRNIDQVIKQEREHLEEIMKLEDTLNRMRTKNFISQMQPHFLYNTLGSIREVVLTNPEYGADLLYDFTTHLRASISAMSSDDEIWFSQELENIRAFVNIEKMRFGDRLDVVYDVEVEDFKIIPFGIQPIVENAIKHGIYEKGVAGGTVVLKAWETEDFWEVSVVDDGIGFDPDEVRRQVDSGERDSTGLQNLIFRLENMMGAEVELTSLIGAGTTVLVQIPKRGSDAS